MTRHHPRAERGFAVLLVLWALVPLTLLFLMLTSTTRSDAQFTAALRQAAELQATADGAINTTIFGLLQPGARVGTLATLRLAGTEVAVETTDLSGFVNPNTAAPELLQALLVRLGVEDARAAGIAGAVVDWRTPGQRARPHGAKAAEYRQARLGYGPPGAPFESLEEVGDVLGMTSAMLAALKPYLSLYAEGDPDPRTAGPAVRAALRDLGAVQANEQQNVQVVQITATAAGAGGAQGARRAVVRIGASSNGRGWRVLAWDTWSGR